MYFSRLFDGTSPFAGPYTVEVGNSVNVDRWVMQFEPGQTTLATLLAKAKATDFPLFVLGPDDKTQPHSSEQKSPRDNVVFEAGLFAGVIGIDRTFLLYAKDTKLPSDLKGLTL